jgi:methionine-rich copper-binding protein CopC
MTVTLAFATLFHAALKSSIPSRGAAIPSPAMVSLTFSEAVTTNLTTIAIVKPDSSVVETLVLKHGVPMATITAPVTHVLAAGRYMVRWNTASDDGHVVRGMIPFSVTAGT